VPWDWQNYNFLQCIVNSTRPHSDSALVLGCVFSESLLHSLPTD
jgi:hypothetical protein